jgi:hypothetical protein
MLVNIRVLSSICVINTGIHFIFILVVSQKVTNERVYIVIQEVKLKVLNKSLREFVLLHSFIHSFIHGVVCLTTRP